MDKTKHDLSKHTAPVLPKHSAKWYEVWGGKCPVCGAVAVVK